MKYNPNNSVQLSKQTISDSIPESQDLRIVHSSTNQKPTTRTDPAIDIRSDKPRRFRLSAEIDKLYGINASADGHDTDAKLSPFWSSVQDQKQHMKDKRSLVQNLFDTDASIHFHLKDLQSIYVSKLYQDHAIFMEGIRQPLQIEPNDLLKLSEEDITTGSSASRTMWNISNCRMNGNSCGDNKPPISSTSSESTSTVDATKSETSQFVNQSTGLNSYRQESVQGLSFPLKQFYQVPSRNARPGQIEQVRYLPRSSKNSRLDQKNITPIEIEVPLSTDTSNGKSIPTTPMDLEHGIANSHSASFHTSNSPSKSPKTKPLLQEMPEGQQVLSCWKMISLKQLLEKSPAQCFYTEPLATYGLYSYDKRTSRQSLLQINRDLYLALSDHNVLLKSFREEELQFGDSILSHLNPANMDSAFRNWTRFNGSLIFDSLWQALEVLFNPPEEISTHQKSPMLRPGASKPSSRKPNQAGEHSNATYETLGRDKSTDYKPMNSNQKYLSDDDAAHLIMICIHALTSHVPKGLPNIWSAVRKLRSWGIILPSSRSSPRPEGYMESWLHIIDAFEYEPALRLAERVVKAVAARRCFSEIQETLSKSSDQSNSKKSDTSSNLMDIICHHLRQIETEARKARSTPENPRNRNQGELGWSVTAVFYEWLRTLAIKKWDRNMTIYRWGPVGGAFYIMGEIYREDLRNRQLGLLTPSIFGTPFFFQHLDQVQAPLSFLERTSNPNTSHLLSFPFLFYDTHLITFFRTINYSHMYQQYHKAGVNYSHQISSAYMTRVGIPNHLFSGIKHIFDKYLILDVRRTHILEDAFNQLWGLERSQILHPLKVKMGVGEGEEGVDHGGVTMEFFRLALTDAFDPDKGEFITKWIVNLVF
jgi:hypothetical protein